MIRNHSLPSYATGSTSSLAAHSAQRFPLVLSREVCGCQRSNTEPNHRTLCLELLTTENTFQCFRIPFRLQEGKVCAEI